MIDDEIMNAFGWDEGKIPIYIFGGLSSISIGGRGPGGRTSDGDWYMELDKNGNPNEEHESIFVSALEMVEDADGDGFVDDEEPLMNNQINRLIPVQSSPYIRRNNGGVLYEGRALIFLHAPWELQFIGSMEKLMGNRLDKTLRDAKAFLKKLLGVRKGEKIDKADLLYWGSIRGHNEKGMREIIGLSITYIDSPKLPKVFEQDVWRWIGC